MKTKNEYKTDTKNAIRVFVGSSTIIFAGALTYCYYTSNFLALSLVVGAVSVTYLLAIFIYKSI